MRQLLPMLIGVPVGVVMGAAIVPVAAVATVLWMLLNPKKSQDLIKEMSAGFVNSIQNVSSVTTQPTSTDSDGEPSKPTGGA